MKTIFHVDIRKKGGGGTGMRKVTDLSFAPPVDIEVEDAAWCDTRKITGVTLSIDESHLYVCVEPERVETEDDVRKLADQYKHFGWKEVGVDA